MRKTSLLVMAVAVLCGGFAFAASLQQKPAAKSAANTVIVYKSPT